jgi:hypothetical protein
LDDKAALSQEPALKELMNDLDTWIAYVPMTVRLGLPFNIKFMETIPLRVPEFRLGGLLGKIEGKLRTVFGTNHRYPIPLKDAPSLHLEVKLDHQELRIPLKEGLPDRRLGLIVWPEGEQPIRGEIDDVFDGDARPSDRILHFYSSRRSNEAPLLDRVAPDLLLFVPLRLTAVMFWGYLAGATAFLAAAGFVGYQLIPTTWTGQSPGLVEEVTVVSSLTVTLSLWLISMPQTAPVVLRKLWLARSAFYLAMVGILVSVIAVMGARLYYGHWVDKKKAPTPVEEVKASRREVVPK